MTAAPQISSIMISSQVNSLGSGNPRFVIVAITPVARNMLIIPAVKKNPPTPILSINDAYSFIITTPRVCFLCGVFVNKDCWL